jgi:hypothetical protein
MRSLRHERVLFLSKRTINRGDRRVASAPWSHAATARPLIRTLKENLLWLRTFDTVEELRQALLVFRELYSIVLGLALALAAVVRYPKQEPNAIPD